MGNKPLNAYPHAINVDNFVGDWYVVALKPTALEKSAFNPMESYTKGETGSKNCLDVLFTYNKGALDGPAKSFPQKLYPSNTDGNWKLQPLKAVPFKLNYVIIDIGGTYSKTEKNPDGTVQVKDYYKYVIVGHPSRSNFWILCRVPDPPQKLITDCLITLQQAGFDTMKTMYPEHKAKQTDDI
eukprot:snap_masked-scaffold_7-processed-gene-11.7-mRNA-1 protein AED:1.00 eAED:1.00 QI:0/0/0/0/1/1/2/0/182